MAAEYAPRNSLVGLARQYAGYGKYRVNTAARHPHTMRRSHFLSPGITAAVASAVAWRHAPSGVWRGPESASMPSSLLVAGVQAVRDAEQLVDAALVPAALAAMHLGYGTGAWMEAARSGPPLAAIAGALGFGRLARAAGSGAEPRLRPVAGRGTGWRPSCRPCPWKARVAWLSRGTG